MNPFLSFNCLRSKTNVKKRLSSAMLILLSIVGIIVFIPEHACCQGVWNHWDKSYSSVNRDAIEKAVLKAVLNALGNRGNKSDKPTSREKQEEREYAEHLRKIRNDIDGMSDWQLLNSIGDSDYRSIILNEHKHDLTRGLASSNRILYYFDNDKELRKLILDTPSLTTKVREEILGKKEKILDFAQDTDLNQLIMSDPYLRECYKEMQARQDIKRDPRTVLNYIKDPYLKQIIKEDPKLHEILGQEMAKKADEEIKRQKQREAEEQKLKELHDADEIAEIKRRENENQKEKTRIADEKNRANEQTIKNEGEIKKNKDLQDDLLSSPAFAPHIPDLSISIPDPLDLMVSDPTAFFGINYTDDRSEKGKDNPKGNNQKTQENYYDENPEKKPYLKEKVDNVKDWLDAKDYPYKANKAFEASKETYSTLIKEAPDNARKKVISIPKDNMIDKLKEWGRNIINIAYPGANLEEKAEIVIEVEKNEKGFIEGIISDIIDAVSTGDLQKFEENTNARTKKFDDKNRSLANRYFKAWGK